MLERLKDKDNTQHWKMIEIVIPTELEKNKEEILYDFTKALSTYGILGRPGAEYNLKAVIEFE